jgi:cytochrome c
MKRLVLAFVISFFIFSVAYAAADSADEAKVMVEKAVAFIKANGKDKAFAEFTDKQGKFIDRHLYIFVVDLTGITLAHGGNDKLVGKDMKGLKDADNNLFIASMIDLAKSKGSGWVDYKWVNPTSKKIEPKTTYIQKVDNYFVGCGTYKR